MANWSTELAFDLMLLPSVCFRKQCVKMCPFVLKVAVCDGQNLLSILVSSVESLSLPSLGQVFADCGSSFCHFLPLCQLSEALGGFGLGFWEIGTEY